MSKSDLAMFRKVVSKQLGNEIFEYKKNVTRVTTGSLKIDDFIDGIVEGSLCEIFGGEASGKSSFASIIAGKFQLTHPDKAVGIIDVEHVWNWDYSKKYGLIDTEDRLVFSQPNSAEEALSLAEKMLESGLFSLVILDSVAAMLTKKQLSGDIGDQTIGELARLMSVALPKINNAASNSKTSMIFINQTRSAIGTFSPAPGGATSTPGGRALKYFCSLRIEIKKRDYIVKGEETIGQEIRVVVRKNKFGRNNGSVDASIYYSQGFKPEDEIVDLCKARNIVKTAGAWIYFGDLKWNGGKVLTDAVRNDPALFESLLSEYKKNIEEERTSISIEMIEREEEENDNDE